MVRWKPPLLCLIVALSGGAFAIAPALRGAPSAPSAADKETARLAFQEGLGLREKGDLKGALAKLAIAYKLARTPRTTYELAQTHERLGNLVEARGLYLEVATIPLDPQEGPESQRARKRSAELAIELEPRIPKLRVELEGVASGAPRVVSIDDETVDADTLALPRRINPGTHEITARSGAASKTVRVTLAEGEARSISLRLEPAAKPSAQGPDVVPSDSRKGDEASERGGAPSRGEAAFSSAPACAVDADCGENMVCGRKPEGGRICEPRREAEPGRRDLFIGLAAQTDLTFVSGADGVCTASGWACVRDGQEVGPFGAGNIGVAADGAGSASGGATLGTTRLLATLGHFLTPSIAIGGRVGLALGGNDSKLAGFTPVHVELELRYYFGRDNPSRFYLAASAGLAQYDAKRQATGVVPTDPAYADDPSCGATPGCVQGVSAWRTAGKAFIALSPTYALALAPGLTLTAGVRVAYALPTTALVLSPAVGLELGL